MKDAHPRRLRQLLARLFLLSGAIVAVATAAGALSFINLLHDRHAVIDRIDPANALTAQVLAAYLDEETAVRGYALSGQVLFLDPYTTGQHTAANADAQLVKLLQPGSAAQRYLGQIHADALAWQQQYALKAVGSEHITPNPFSTPDALRQGKSLFDQLRAAITNLQQQLLSDRHQAVHQLNTASDELGTIMVVSLAVLLITGLIVWVSLDRLVLSPLSDVATDARTVASGDLVHAVRRTGPEEIAALADDLEAMRLRVLDELERAASASAELAEKNADLARSNEELEQFAYVASHDLQEPLRKVTSFCQLIEQRYGGQLDERGEQYIAFAVDGAKRMQVLINDLLAFSRIGRTTDHFERVPLAECAEQALRNLGVSLEQTGGDVQIAGDLPTVDGDRSLLTALMQNLIGNALKFHGDVRPVVKIAGRRSSEEGMWELTVTDNGIGIEPRFAERIFIIFQRLHGRDAYSGTGIGLAMCRKIVEFHGGRIWLDVDHQPGTRFCFTLPMIGAEEERQIEFHGKLTQG